MKNKILLLLCLFSISIFTAQAQDYAPVVFGERPPIDLDQISKDAYKKGIIKIKFNASFSDQLSKSTVSFDQEGNLIFGIAEVDELNKIFKPQSFELVFGSVALKNQFTDRHKLWGLHLWYKLEFDENVNIKELVEKYSKLAEVEIAEPEYRKRLYDGVKAKNAYDFKWTPNDTRYDEQWHYHNTGQTSGTVDCDIDLPEAWNIETGHEDVIVSIEDQGIDTDHSDIAANMWSGVGYDFVDDNTSIEPDDHGSHVAGTVAGVNNNSNGISGVAGGDGTTPGISLMSCQVFHPSNGSGGFDTAPIWAADNGACISQNSWGYTSAGAYDQSTLDAIDYFNANGGGSQLNGGITIYAAGNDGTEDEWYPGYYSGAFAVAATTHTDEKAWYSNYGTWVNVSAPGGETSTTSEGVLSCFDGGGYGFYQGTSMACPHVSGVAALVVSYAYRNGVVLDNSDVADILENTTDDHYGVNGSYTGKLGTGRLNAYQALVETDNYISGVLNPASLSATAVSSSQIDLDWTKNDDVNDVMLAWSADGTFGTPIDGTSYSAGNSISGGGTVLYVGALTDYNHTSLTAGTTYYYKAWSLNGSTEYSSGRASNETTFCGDFSLPYSEDFNSGDGCWVGDGGTDSWLNVSPATAHDGNCFLTNGNSNYADEASYILTSPDINMSAFTDIEVTFYMWMEIEDYTDPDYWDGGFIECYDGSSWIKMTNSELSENYDGTLTDVSGNIYAGEEAYSADRNWMQVTITLPVSFENVSNFKIRYKLGSDQATNDVGWAIDDIAITGTVSSSEPVADFSANITNPAVAETVTFTDLSANIPTSWSWSFSPTDITYVNATSSTSQNPQVQFGTQTDYTVTLTATNGFGNDEETKTSYINVCNGVVMDNTGTWTEQATGFATASRGIKYISIVDENNVWAIAYDGSGGGANVQDFTRTTNGGTDWTASAISGYTDYGLSMIFATDANTAYVPMYDAVSGGGIIVKTTNSGTSWGNILTFSDATASFPNVIHFFDANNGFCQGDPTNDGTQDEFELYTTSNAGADWTRVPGANIPDPIATDEYGTTGYYEAIGDIIWFTTNKGRVFKSIDKGLNWTVVQTPVTANQLKISFSDENSGIIKGSSTSNYYKTTDGGATWTLISSTGNFYNTSFSYVPGTCKSYVSTGADGTNGVSYSDDSGNNWTDLNSPQDAGTNIQLTEVAFYNRNTGWAGQFNADETTGGIYKYSVSTPTPIATVTSTPDCESGSVTVSSDLTGTQMFYLRDNSGGAISNWTGDATSHEFTGLSDGTYRGQVEKNGNMSALSSATTLTNFENPVAPTSVQATETEICNGSSTTLSCTGGSGDTFDWYTASCGGTSVGTGQNLSVSPTTTTTYYGRWETSGCGESTCRAITITVNPLPTAPSSVSATSTEICEGESTTLSYTGGSGDIFGWYTASCGGTSVGNGQNLSVNPTATTIYYGRWENICGASTCETVEITVNENIVADAGLDDSTCDEVYTMNANNPAPGMGSWSLLAGAAIISNPDNPNTDITITSSPVTLRWTVVNGTCTTYDDVTITQSNATYIVSHPQDIIADEGTNANFSVTASGENLSFQWRKNGAELSDGGNISGATTNNLLVSNVTAADAGDYDVVVTGDCGTLTSDAAVLDVVTLRDELENFGISIYPNPTNDFVNITIDENVKSAKVNITTLSGRTIFKGGLVQGRVYELDMSDYASGVYLMSVQTKERVITVKLIKE